MALTMHGTRQRGGYRESSSRSWWRLGLLYETLQVGELVNALLHNIHLDLHVLNLLSGKNNFNDSVQVRQSKLHR
jgi:hypothetical protein